MTSSSSLLQPHLPGHEPTTPRSLVWRVTILAVLGLSIVAGIVYGVFNHRVTNVTPPPTLGGTPGAGYSGSFIGTGANGKSYFAFDEADKTAFAAGKATLVAATPNPAPLAAGVNYMYADSAMTMKDIITRIDPSMSATKLVVAFYTPGGETGIIPNASTVKGFYAFPNGAYAGTNQITASTTFDDTAKSDLTKFTVPAHRVFIVVVDGATEIYGVHDTSKSATAVGNFSSLTSDWIQVAGSTTVEDTVSPYKCQIASVWAQNRLWAADGASDYSLVTLNTTTDTTKNHTLTTFHTLWVNLKPAPVGGCSGSTPGDTQDPGTTSPPPAIEGLSVNITEDGPAVNWIPATPDAKTSDLTDGTKYYYNYRWELTEKGKPTPLLWSKNWEEAFTPLTTGDVQPELKHKKDSNKKFKNLWVGNTFIVPKSIQKKLVAGEYTLTLYRGNGTDAVSASKDFTVTSPEAIAMGATVAGETPVAKTEPTIKKKTNNDAVRNVKFEKVAGQDISNTATTIKVNLADLNEHGLAFYLKDPNTSSRTHLTDKQTTYVMTYQWALFKAVDMKLFGGGIAHGKDPIWESTRGELGPKGSGVYPFSTTDSDPCKYPVTNDGETKSYVGWVCPSADITGSMIRELKLAPGYYTLEGRAFDTATGTTNAKSSINIEVVGSATPDVKDPVVSGPETIKNFGKEWNEEMKTFRFLWDPGTPDTTTSYLTDGTNFYYNYMWELTTKSGVKKWSKEWTEEVKSADPVFKDLIRQDIYRKSDAIQTKLTNIWTANFLIIPAEVKNGLTAGEYTLTLSRGNGTKAVSSKLDFTVAPQEAIAMGAATAPAVALSAPPAIEGLRLEWLEDSKSFVTLWDYVKANETTSDLTDGKLFYYNYKWELTTKSGVKKWSKEWHEEVKSADPVFQNPVAQSIYRKSDANMAPLTNIWISPILPIPTEIQKGLTAGEYTFTLHRGNGVYDVSASKGFTVTAEQAAAMGATTALTPVTIAADLQNLKIVQDPKNQYRFTFDTSGLTADYSAPLMVTNFFVSSEVKNPDGGATNGYLVDTILVEYKGLSPTGTVTSPQKPSGSFYISKDKTVETTHSAFFGQKFPVASISVPPIPAGSNTYITGSQYKATLTILFGGKTVKSQEFTFVK